MLLTASPSVGRWFVCLPDWKEWVRGKELEQRGCDDDDDSEEEAISRWGGNRGWQLFSLRMMIYS